MKKTLFCSPGSWRAPCATPRLPRRGPERWWAEGWSANKLILKVNSCKLHLFFFKTLGNFQKKLRTANILAVFSKHRQVWINKDTKVICQGMTGRQGTFHTTQARSCPTSSDCFTVGQLFHFFRPSNTAPTWWVAWTARRVAPHIWVRSWFFFSGDSSSFWRCQVWPFRVLEMWISGEQKSNLFTQLWRSCFFFESQCSSSTLLWRNWDLPIFANCMEAKKETRWGVAKRSPLKWVTSQLEDFCSLFFCRKKNPSDFWGRVPWVWVWRGCWVGLVLWLFFKRKRFGKTWPASHWGIGR